MLHTDRAGIAIDDTVDIDGDEVSVGGGGGGGGIGDVGGVGGSSGNNGLISLIVNQRGCAQQQLGGKQLCDRLHLV